MTEQRTVKRLVIRTVPSRANIMEHVTEKNEQ